MNIIEGLQAAGHKVMTMLSGDTVPVEVLPVQREYSDPNYKRTTTASRRQAQQQLDNSRMHVSKAIPQQVYDALALGPLAEVASGMPMSRLISTIMRRNKGDGATLVLGNNYMKAHADALGVNNKQRRKYRTKLKRMRDSILLRDLPQAA